MKQLPLIIVLALLGGMMFTSCKKDYVCTCTMTALDTSLVFVQGINNTSKKLADAECDGNEAAYQKMSGLFLGSANCTLEKE